MEIDYASAYEFIRPAQPEVKWQLRFALEESSAGNPWQTNPAGQLVATIVDCTRPDNGRTVGISRPHIHFLDAETAVDQEHWPFMAPYTVDLDAIERRIIAAGLT